MSDLLKTQHYLTSKAVYANQVLADFNDYKAYPWFTYFFLPNSVSSLGYSVASKIYNKNVSIGNNSSQINYSAPTLLDQVYYDLNTNYFADNLIVLNYKTQSFSSYISSSSTGYAYRLVKGIQPINNAYKSSVNLEKIGNYNDIRDKYINSVVLTEIYAYEDDGSENRPYFGYIDGTEARFNIYSVSSCEGRSYFNENGEYEPNHHYNQSNYGGYLLVNNSAALTSTRYVTYNGRATSYAWLEMLNKVGAEVVVFDTDTTDKTGQELKRGVLAVIFPTAKDIKKLGNSLTVPFVVDNEEMARTGDIKNFPLYDPPGVPENETGGGEGNGDNESDKVDEAKNPDLSPIAAGNNLYAMTQAELEQTFDFLWDGHNKDILGVTVSEANIIDSLCNCFYFPFDILAHDTAHCSDGKVVAAGYESEISSKIIGSGYDKRFSFGDIDVQEYYGSYLDYAPYTTITIYLPYIGFKQLDVSKVMGKTINVTYGVDFSQGIVTAYISYYYDGNKQIFAEFSGQMGIPLKVTGKNTTAAENAVKDAAFAVGGFALAAISVLAAPATGGASLIGTAGAVGAGVNAIGSTINATTIQPDSVSIGNAGAENWLISPQGCYVYIQRPTTATPENFNKTNGWATRYTGTISEFTDYLECSTVINTVSATAEEKNQITNLLKQGVYI